MKNIILLLSVMALFSCSEEKIENNVQQKNKELIALPEAQGVVPKSHKIYDMMREPAKVTLNAADNFYRSEVAISNEHYSSGLKSFGFILVMKKGLAIDGTEEQKRFYIEEQLKMDTNLATIPQFYNLLVSCNEFIEQNKLIAIGRQFYEKVKVEIENTTWPDPQKKKDKLLKLKQQHGNLYKRLQFSN